MEGRFGSRNLKQVPEQTASKDSTESRKVAWQDLDVIETAKGSTYRYLPDGRTQRFKKVEGREYEPQTALVYVPDFEWVKKNAPTHVLEKFENRAMYEEVLLEYVRNPHKDGRATYIVDAKGKYVETNKEIWEIKQSGGQIYLAFSKHNHADFLIPVSHKPLLGWMTFDTRTYDDEETGERMRERHLGNPVVKITLKQDLP